MNAKISTDNHLLNSADISNKKIALTFVKSLRTSIITKKFFGSGRLGEPWFIYYWNNFCSQVL
ncbi:hypothetical protein BpHYR1_036799 [Brachionus plicatilis]|uniref:Uncharacterized protein n=1 Tax=Brachionus plicatilis TaxID=10195 RepID=A0A3M7RYL9_BRAPC|nr:hypothetical protein BpHYR1_036799 [Brachionus plicatilis]